MRYNDVNWSHPNLRVKVFGDGEVRVTTNDRWSTVRLPVKLVEAIQDCLRATFAHGERCGYADAECHAPRWAD